MAGVYPIGMKMAASWASDDLGMLCDLVGAPTPGRHLPISSTPSGATTGAHHRRGPRPPRCSPPWRSSRPAQSGAAPRAFEPRYPTIAFRDRALRLANLGHLGHMWSFTPCGPGSGRSWPRASRSILRRQDPAFLARIATFVVMGLGGLAGCLAGGWLADRFPGAHGLPWAWRPPAAHAPSPSDPYSGRNPSSSASA